MNTQTSTEVQDYLDRMRDALADLPAAEVGEIMDDAGAHVVEVAEEMGEEFSLAALMDRLGTPQAYARELRAAAGYPDRAPDPSDEPQVDGPTILARFAFWSLVAGTAMAFSFALSRGDAAELTLVVGLCTAAAALLVFRQGTVLPEVERLPETTALKEMLTLAERSDSQRVLASVRVLQPVWWLARALLIAAAGVVLYRLSGLAVVAWGLAALSLVAAVKVKGDRRWLWISLPATGFALGLLLFGLGSVVSGFDSRDTPIQASYSPQPPSNIYVFDKDGKPLTDVYLYDENGRPLNAPWYGCGSDRDDNLYPRPRVEHGQNGCREIPGVPFAVFLPTTTLPTTTPSPTASPSGSTSPAPSAPTTVTPTG